MRDLSIWVGSAAVSRSALVVGRMRRGLAVWASSRGIKRAAIFPEAAVIRYVGAISSNLSARENVWTRGKQCHQSGLNVEVNEQFAWPQVTLFIILLPDFSGRCVPALNTGLTRIEPTVVSLRPQGCRPRY